MEFVKSKGVIPMSSDYLKKDKERVENKFKELKSKGEIEAIEKRLESLEDADSSINRIWAEIYRDVLDLKKKEEEHEDKDWSVFYSSIYGFKYSFSQIKLYFITNSLILDYTIPNRLNIHKLFIIQ